MKAKFLTFLFICLSGLLFGQNFSKDYYEFCRPSWEKQVSEAEKKAVNPKMDSMIFTATGRHMWEIDVQKEIQSTNDRILYYKRIMKLKDLDIDKLTDFILIEESSLRGDWNLLTVKTGIVVYGDQYFSYSINLTDSNSLVLNNNFLEDYTSIDKKDPRSILFHLAKNNKPDEIAALAAKEMDLNNTDQEVSKQFEVMIYNKESANKIRLCFLHDQIVYVYK